MNDEKYLCAPAQVAQPGPDTAGDNIEHALFGKIARLPHDIREQLNLRLHDNKTYPEILVWLNELPAVKETLAARFDGKPINAPNLTHWRQTGYQRWCREREHIADAEKLGEFAATFTKAAGGHFAPAAAAVTAGKIFEFIQNASAEQLTPEVLVKCGAISSALAETEQNYTRLELARERKLQMDEHLLISAINTSATSSPSPCASSAIPAPNKSKAPT